MLKKYKTIGVSLVINIAVVVILSLISYPQYKVDIDIMMQSVIYDLPGTGGNSNLIFSNMIIGEILKLLISVFPTMPWYTIFHYSCVFVSLFIIGYIFLKENGGVSGNIIWSIFAIFVGYECYIELGYMKTASIVCVAEIYLLHYLLEKRKKGYFLFLAVPGILLSSMISWTSFCITALISIVLSMLYFIIKEPRRLLNKYLLLVFVISLAGCTGIKLIDTQIYKSSDEWNTALEYKNSVEKITVFGAPEYSMELYEQLKIDEEKYDSLISGVYVSPNESGLELLKEIASIYKDFNFENVLDFFRTVPIHMFKIGLFFCFLLLVGLSYFSVKERKGKIFLISTGMLFIVSFAAYMLNAWNNTTIEVLAFLPLCIFMLMNCKNVKIQDIKEIASYLLILGLILYSEFSYRFTTSVAQEDMLWAFSNEMREGGVQAIDLNRFLQGYSAYVSYIPELIEYEKIKIVNGNYLIYPMYRDKTVISKVDIWNGITWVDEEKNIEEIFIE